MIKPKDLKRMVNVKPEEKVTTDREKENIIISFLNSEMLVWYAGGKGICAARTFLKYFDFSVSDKLCIDVSERYVKKGGWDKVYYKIDQEEGFLYFIFIMDKRYDEYFISEGYKVGATKRKWFQRLLAEV